MFNFYPLGTVLRWKRSITLFLLIAVQMPAAFAAHPGTDELITSIRQSLANPDSKSEGLERLIAGWKKSKQPQALFKSLSEISMDRSQADQTRYASFMGALRIGGLASLDLVSRLSEDSSWLLRSAAIKGAELLITQSPSTRAELRKHAPEEPQALYPALLETLFVATRDKALVVRLEAVESLGRIWRNWNPASVEFLAQAKSNIQLHVCNTLADSRNYHSGEPQWVPQAAASILSKQTCSAEILRKASRLASKRH